jgi:adenine phosphoribosyltransferase
VLPSLASDLGLGHNHGVKQDAADLVRQTILDVPDFPKPGIVYKDLTPVFQSPSVMQAMISAFVDRYRDKGLEAVVAVESRGFILGAPIALELGLPLVLARKKGKLPRAVVQQAYGLEYGEDVLEMHVDALSAGQRVVLIDDLLATGGTAAAAKSLVEKIGGDVVESAFIVELGFIDWAQKLSGDVFSLVRYT